MNQKEFNILIDQLEDESLKTLKEKNSKYAPFNDALRNFHVGAEIMGTTTGECVWGYATKHISSLRDRIKNNNWDDLDDVKEKIQDTINYLRFLWCVANEESYMNSEVECFKCKFATLGDDDENWNASGSSIIKEPCKSCKNNFIINSEEYNNHKLNFEPLNNQYV